MKKSSVMMYLFLIVFGWFAGNAFCAETVRIAAIFPKTGIPSLEIALNFRGVEIAVDEINRNGGVLGRLIEVIELDNKGTPVGSQEAAEEAVRQNVTAVIGSAWSSHSLAMAPVLQKAKIPMIANISTHPDVTKAGHYIFRVCFIDPFQGKVMAYFAREDLKANTAAILTDVSGAYSIGLSEYFRDAFTSLGGKILMQGKYIQKDVDFGEMLRPVKSKKPDIIFLPGYSRDSGLIIRQARDMKISATILGGDGWGTLIHDLVGNVVDGSYFCGHIHPDSPFPRNKQLRQYYKGKYGVDIPIEGLILAYDAVYLLADAMVRAESLDREKIRDALASTKDFFGATGRITFDQDRNPKDKDAVITKFENGKIVYVKTIRPESGEP